MVLLAWIEDNEARTSNKTDDTVIPNLSAPCARALFHHMSDSEDGTFMQRIIALFVINVCHVCYRLPYALYGIRHQYSAYISPRLWLKLYQLNQPKSIFQHFESANLRPQFPWNPEIPIGEFSLVVNPWHSSFLSGCALFLVLNKILSTTCECIALMRGASYLVCESMQSKTIHFTIQVRWLCAFMIPG